MFGYIFCLLIGMVFGALLYMCFDDGDDYQKNLQKRVDQENLYRKLNNRNKE